MKKSELKQLIKEELAILTEADEIIPSDLPKDRIALLKKLNVAVLVSNAWSGIHGYVVRLVRPIGLRFDKRDLNLLVKSPIVRWIEWTKEGLHIGF